MDKEYQAEIEKLQVNCSFVAKGCSWSGQVKDLQVKLNAETSLFDVVVTRCVRVTLLYLC